VTAVVPLSVTSAAVADAYDRVGRGNANGPGGDFSATLQRALEGVAENIHAADTKAMEAVGGEGNMTDVITAIARAELALQTATTVRDRVVQAYQDIMKMPI